MTRRASVEYEFKPPHSGVWGEMHYEIYDDDPNKEAVVILADGNHTGRSLTNEMESVVSQIVAGTILEPYNTIWVQHTLPRYEGGIHWKETWSLVKFEWQQDNDGWWEAKNAQWLHVELGVVEQLIGRSLSSSE